MNNYQIRNADRSDYDAIGTLFYNAPEKEDLVRGWAITSDKRKTFSDDLSEEESLDVLRFRTNYLAKDGKWLVAEQNNKIVGAMVARITSREAEAIIIDSQYRRKGIGYNLFRETLKYLFELDNNPVKTATGSQNEAAVSLITKVGFKETSRKQDPRYGRPRVTIYYIIEKDEFEVNKNER